MKKQVRLSFLFLLPLLFLIAITVRADTIGDADKTTVKVRITEPPIYLKQVKPPTFGRYQVREEAFDIQAESDLVIDVVDKREKDNQWRLTYKLSVFKNEVAYDAKLTLKNGQFSAVDKPDYQMNDIENINDDKTFELIEVMQGSGQTYRITIPKEAITINVPANSPSGTYEAIQTVNLVNVVTDVD